MDEEPRWVEGLWSAQKDVEGGTILGARMLLKGLPQSVDANYTSKGDKIDLELSLDDFNSRETAEYVIFQEEGIIGPKVTALIEDIPVGLDLTLNADLTMNATVNNLTLKGNVTINTNKQIGPVYLVIEQFEEENPYRIEAFVPSLPGNMEIEMDIKDELLDFEIKANQAIDLVAIEID